MKNYSISVVIPNWNGKYLLEKNLPGVMKSISKGTEVIVVDDNSTDDSVRFLNETYKHVTVLQKETHEGFVSSVNLGVRMAKGNLVVLLNTDIVPEQNFLKPILPHFDDKEVFAVGCMDKSIEGELEVLRGRGKAFWKNGMFMHSLGELNKSDTDWVSGGSGIFRRDLWLLLGGMDSLFNPFYWEDIDLSYRARKAGYKLIFEAKAVVYHNHEEGVIKKSYSPSQIKAVAYRNQFTFIWKNISDVSLLSKHILWLPIYLIRALASGDVPMLFGFIRALVRLPEIISSRSKSRLYWTKNDHDILSTS